MTANGFFTELQRIILSQPKLPVAVVNCENCIFCNEVYNSKNLSYCFDTYSTSDSFYLFDSFMCATCGDCDYAVESEFCYESVDPYKAFNCNYLEYCDNIRDSEYCYKCSGNNLFGCVNLKNKSFCIFNRQLTESEYNEKIIKFKSLPPEKILAIVEKLKKRFPLTQTIAQDNENTTYGNYIHFDKNCYLCFDAAHDENCSYLYDSFHNKTSYDLTYVAVGTELSYQAVDSATLFNCNFCMHDSNCQDSSYLFSCFNVKNSLGCVGLKNKEYCILNRQFTKEEYEKISREIFTQLNTANLGWNNLIY
ncbi:MAG: hypothetical protein HY425_01595 [Candidatus Levybacteria bacterium]|nr:hypothetical protein [Candidatus Levybacteria bacterium]